jgi:putative acetyltransferase
VTSVSCDVIRPLEARDELAADAVIRAVRREFGVTGDGFDDRESTTPDLVSIYDAPRSAYFVVERAGLVLGGAGIAPYGGAQSEICELQRMYLLPAARGTGLGRALLAKCLAAARTFRYRRCYLETAASLATARRLYLHAGFREVAESPGQPVHPSCDAYYVLDLEDGGRAAAP